MKTRFLSIMLICMLVICYGCNNEVDPRETEENPTQSTTTTPSQDLEPQPYVLIVKFKDPSYKEHLIVSDYSNGEGGDFILMRGNNCERTQYLTFGYLDADGSKINGEAWDFAFPERLRDPFWALPDGWYLIDWAWSISTPYPFRGNTVLTEITFDNYRNYGVSEFDNSVPHISKDYKELYDQKEIKIADLMGYSYPDGKYPSYKLHIYGKYTYRDYNYDYDYDRTFTNPNSYHQALMRVQPVSHVKNCLCEVADELDTYWAQLQNQLTTLINNGDLDNLKTYDVNQLHINE